MVSFPVAVKYEEEKGERRRGILTSFKYCTRTWHEGYSSDTINTFYLTECRLGWKFHFFLFVSA